MKIKHVLPLSTLLLCSTPLLLTGCNSMDDMYGPSHSTPRYDYNNPANKANMPANAHHNGAAVETGKGGIVKKKAVTATTLADPGETAVVHPKTAATPAAVPLSAPSVAQ